MMGGDLARALDPVLFARDCGVAPDPWQADLLRAMPRRALLLCARQSGKTTATALMALWSVVYEPGSLVVLASPSQRQSDELLKTLMRLHGALPAAPPLLGESRRTIELKNGSRILSLPGGDGRTVRGIAGAAMIVVDEASRVEDDLLAALRPMMATKPDARMIALTTPAGRRGWFHDTWHSDEDWVRVKVPASMCPRISREFLAEELRNLGSLRYSEEYDLQFVDNDEAVFPAGVVARAFTAEVQPLWT